MSQDLQLFTIPTAVSSDARFKQGRLFLKDKQYEESIEMFSSLLQSCNASYGEMSVESAVAYYEYGNALLLKEEENPSNDLLGNVDAAASNDSKHVEDEDVDDEDEDAEGETEDRPKAVEEDDEPEGDLQIAWEVLDVARCILEKQSGPACKSFLSDVYMRLGDLMRFNSNVAASIEEYQKALSIRLSSCAPHDRMISDTHFSLAVAYVYNASEKDSDVDPEQEKRKALSHYKKSQESISSWIELFKDSAAEEELLDRREVHDMLQETIDSLDAELGQVTRQSSSSSSTPSVPVPADGTTTVGFGTASSGSSQLPSAVPIQTLQAKPKKRALEESNGNKTKRT